MTNHDDMARAQIDNAWVAEGLKATHQENKALAQILGIHPSGVTRILNNKRALKDFETAQIKEWFRTLRYNVPPKRHSADEDLTPISDTSDAVTHMEVAKEGVMPDKTLMKLIELLIDEVRELKDQNRAQKGGSPAHGQKSKRRRKNP